MTSMKLIDGSLFVEVKIRANGQELLLDNILVDTGSETTLFRIEDLKPAGIFLEPTDMLVSMSGIGGEEKVVEKQVDTLEVDELIASSFTIQMGAVNYGFGINGILGLNFLIHTGAQINLRSLTLRKE